MIYIKKWPEFDDNGDLPAGVHQATLTEILQNFGTENVQRARLGQRLERVYTLVNNTGN